MAYRGDFGLEPNQKSFVFNQEIFGSREYIIKKMDKNRKEIEIMETTIDYLKKLNNTLLKSYQNHDNQSINIEDDGTKVTFNIRGNDYIYNATWLKEDSSINGFLSIKVKTLNGKDRDEFDSIHTFPIPKTIDLFKEDINHWIKDLERYYNLEQKNPKIWGCIDFVYFSAVTQLTIGYGDIIPNSTFIRFLVFIQGSLSAFFMIVVVGFVSSSCSLCEKTSK